jgi:uracil-DNA glycosylase
MSCERIAMTQTCWNSVLETDWGRLLRQEFEEPYWAALQSFVEGERSSYDVYPPCEEVFAALVLTEHADSKVVILGQDPYHGVDQAHGLAFSVRCGVPVPPSLKNIHKELNEDMSVSIPNHGSLEQWARRGVLLLNPTMTVRAGEAGSHLGKGWEMFTNKVIQAVDRKRDRVVFILWGAGAQKKARLIDTSSHVVISSSHPSPISACRTSKPFCGSRPFSRTNKALVAARLEEIDWTLDDCPDSAN